MSRPSKRHMNLSACLYQSGGVDYRLERRPGLLQSVEMASGYFSGSFSLTKLPLSRKFIDVGENKLEECLSKPSGGFMWGANSFERSVDLSDISDNVFHMQLELTNLDEKMQEINPGQRTSTV